MIPIAVIGRGKDHDIGTLRGANAVEPDRLVVDRRAVSFARRRLGIAGVEEAGIADRIELTVAPAVETLDRLLAQGLEGQIDLAFIDADKQNYDNYYERCLRLVRSGGLLLVDNVLWGGSVADPADKDGDTQAIRALNAKLQADERVDVALSAVGDGMTCAVKL